MTAEGEGKPGHCWVVRCGICFRLPKIQCTRVMITLTVSNSRNHFSPTIHTIWTPGINLRGDTQAMVVMCLVYSFDSPGSYPHMSIGVQSFHVIARRDCTCSHTSVFDAVRVKYWKGTYSVTFVTSVPWLWNEYCVPGRAMSCNPHTLLSKKSEMGRRSGVYIARRPSHFGGLWRAAKP